MGGFDFSPVPFQNNTNGKLSGPDIDIIRDVFSRLPRYELEEYIVPVARAAQEFPQGRIDFLLLLKSPGLSKVSMFSNTPIRRLHFKLAVLEGSDLDYISIESLKGKNIGMMSGIPLEGKLKEAADNNYFNLIRLRDYPNLLGMLSRHRLDAVLGSIPTLRRRALEMGIELKYLRKTPDVMRGYFAAISLRSSLKDKEHLHQEISRILLTMRADGSYERIYSHYDVSQDEYWPTATKEYQSSFEQ